MRDGRGVGLGAIELRTLVTPNTAINSYRLLPTWPNSRHRRLLAIAGWYQPRRQSRRFGITISHWWLLQQ